MSRIAVEKLLSGAVQYIESCPGATQVKLVTNLSCSLQTLVQWEKVNGPLPKDLVDFYQVSNGIHLEWSTEYTKSKMGCIQIYPIEDMKPFQEQDRQGFSISDKTYLCPDGIWYYDTEWVYITDTFSAYFRLLVAHLGIIGWQTCFSECQVMDWLNLYCPERALVYRSRNYSTQTLSFKPLEFSLEKVYKQLKKKKK